MTDSCSQVATEDKLWSVEWEMRVVLNNVNCVDDEYFFLDLKQIESVNIIVSCFYLTFPYRENEEYIPNNGV